MEEKSSNNNLPAKCPECAKSSKPFIHGQCILCQNIGFQEEVLCYLNQSTQDTTSFECHAFQPVLKLVTPSGQETRSEPRVKSREIPLERLLDSDKLKYQRALALQKLARNPDDVMIIAKYHFVWNVAGRRPTFSEPTNTLGVVSGAIMDCSEAVGGFAELLRLAPDHIHVYVESDGEVSPDNIAQKLKRLSETRILERFPDLTAFSEAENRLWDGAYFVETLS